MIKTSDLPTNPSDAFQVLLRELQLRASTFPNGALDSKMRADAVSSVRKLMVIRKRIPNPEDYAGLLESILGQISGSSPRQAIGHLESIEELFISNSLDEHLIDTEQEELLNTLEWQQDDRTNVLKSLGEARNFVSYSSTFDDRHKTRVLYWISKAENEVFKERGKWAQVRAAVSEIGDLAQEIGEKAQPLANLVRTVRTTTQRNISEVRQIAADEKPKQLEAPK